MIGKKIGRGGRPLRIAYGRVFHEGNAFSPLLTTERNFRDFHYYEGSALAERCTLRGHELEGFLRHAELSGFVQAARLAGQVETLPLMSAMTVPSGRVTPETFAWIRSRLAARLSEVGPVDAVYLALHGSMQVKDLLDAPEGVLIADAKLHSGGAPIAASFDLHANLSPSMADPLTVLTAYRTNPHRDLLQTGFRAGQRLIRALRAQIQPTHAWRKLPMVLGGGTTVDFLEPMRPIFRYLKRLEKDPRVLTAHIFMVHPYNNAPDLGWAVHVTTDGDSKLADELADELANRVFETRRVQPPAFMGVKEALQTVKRSKLARSTGSISLVDVGDVVGAGSPGGNTHLLRDLLEDPNAARVYIPVHDPEAVTACAKVAIGEDVELVVRGIETEFGQPEVPIRARLAAKFSNESGQVVRLDVGKLSIALTERIPLTIAPRFWREIGLSPFDADAIVQKTFFHYRFFYLASNRGNIGVDSAGPTSLDNLRKLDLELPVWPMHKVEDWRSFDRVRRGRT